MTQLKQSFNWPTISLLLLVIGALLLWPTSGLALDECQDIQNASDFCSTVTPDTGAGDCDSDGFTDFEECNGFALNNGGMVYGYDPDAIVSPGDIRLNPRDPDLLFMAVDNLDNELQSGLMFDALNNQNALVFYADGLKIHAHKVRKINCNDDRTIPNTANAVRATKIAEFTTPSSNNDNDLGRTKVSVPTDIQTVSRIYTERIREDVFDEKCKTSCCSVWADRKTPLVNLCSDATTDEKVYLANKAVFNFYMLQVIAHEVGHGTILANDDPATYFHHIGSDTMMDPAVSFKRTKYTMPITFLLPEDKGLLKLYDSTYTSN